MGKRYCGGNRRCNVIVEHIADPPKALHLTAIPLRPIAAGELIVILAAPLQLKGPYARTQ